MSSGQGTYIKLYYLRFAPNNCLSELPDSPWVTNMGYASVAVTKVSCNSRFNPPFLKNTLR